MSVLVQQSGNFQKLVGLYENPLLEYWQDKYTDTMKDSMISTFFTKEQSDNATEAISELVGGPKFGEWKGEFTYGQQKEGNTKVWTPLVWQAGMAYDRFFLSNAKLLNLKNQQGKFALAAARLREYATADVFTNADKANYTRNGVTLNWTVTADGLPVASTEHPYANAAGTQSNLSTNALSEANLESAMQAMFAFKDEDGNDANLQPDTLVVPTALRQTALELIGGPGKYDTDKNNPNIYYGNVKVIVYKQFRKQEGKTDQPWFIMDSQAAKDSAKLINRLESGEDFELSSWKKEEVQQWFFGALQWFSAGIFDFRPYFFNIPA